MLWGAGKYTVAAVIGVVTSSMWLTATQAGEEKITFNVPVKVQNIMEDVIVLARCVVLNSIGEHIGEGQGQHIQPTNGSVNSTSSVEALPFPGKSFMTAKKYFCFISLIKGNENTFGSGIIFKEPSGAPDDWRYAKPGMPLVWKTGHTDLPSN